LEIEELIATFFSLVFALNWRRGEAHKGTPCVYKFESTFDLDTVKGWIG